MMPLALVADREDGFRMKGPSKENRKDPIVGLGLLLMGIGYIALDARLIRGDKAGETPKYFKDVDDEPKEA